MTNITKEEAASEVIGVILLLSIVTICIGIIAVYLVSNTGVQQTPYTDILIEQNKSNNDKTILFFQQGEPLDFNETLIQFNSENTNKAHLFRFLSNNQNWTGGTFKTGDILFISGVPISKIDIIFQKGSNRQLLKSVEF